MQALATITSPKGVITIDGFSSHIAPIMREDTEALKAIELDEVGLKHEFRIGGWVRAMKGAALVKEHIFGATCTICGIQTGHTEAGAKTVLPSTAMARLDFRLVPDLTPQMVVELLREHLDVRGFKDIEIIELGSAPLAKVVGEVARRASGDRIGDGSLWKAAADLSDGSFEWAGRRGLWRVSIRRRRLRLSARVTRDRIRMGRTKTFASMIFCRASSLSGA